MNGDDIRAILKNHRIFQWELAAQLGISEFTLCCWFRGPISESRARAIQEAIAQLERPEKRSKGRG